MRVLVADQEQNSRHLLELFLTRWGYKVQIAENVNDVWSAFYDGESPHCIILDWTMPDMDGRELCRRLRERPTDEYVYILLTTVRDRREDIIEGLSVGADDYITKPFDARELRIRLRVGQRILDLQSELLGSQKLLEVHAMRDPVTGFWTQSAVVDILGREVNRARRELISLSLVIVQFQGLAELHRQWEPEAYDLLLSSVAERLRRSVRSYDALGRYFEQRFIVMLPGCDESRASIVVKRIERFVAAEPFSVRDESLPLAVRVAVASLGPDETLDANALIRAAEAAL